jgi:DNA invertase Pin-like site-specific DNA recombinase
MVKVYSYLRVSGKGQVQGDGLPRQRAAIRVVPKTAGHKIEQEFGDEGVSGAIETADRLAFDEMLKKLRSNGARTVLIERLDRLARDVIGSGGGALPIPAKRLHHRYRHEARPHGQ